MDLSGLLDLVTNPVGALVGGVFAGAVSIIGFQVYKIAIGIFNPAKYIERMYTVADKLVETLDDRVIDVFLPKAIKKDFQSRVRTVLEKRRGKINSLIQRISD